MAKNMTFSVSLKLLTKNFQNGIKSIQNSLGRLRQQFSTLMGGIGLGMGLKELVEQAKSLDKAQTTLRNVSNTAEAYGENMKFLQGLAKKYNQDIIVLMGNFAKFHSAAAYANMSLEDQQHVYEALTRASAYFNLTADETNGVMLAVQQMISKGRVSSEELRRQLGERLPGAMNLAAKAMRMTTADLDKQIRLGNIAANDMLPRLATELNNLTKSFDVNTIQGATNKLQNAFTDLVQKLDVGGIYKKFLNALSKGLEYLGDNLRNIATSITTVLSAIMLKGGMQKGWNAWSNFFKKIDDSLKKSQTNLKIFKKELDVLAKNKGVKYDVAQDGTISLDPAKNGKVMIDAFEEAEEHAKNYNRELKKSNTLQDQLNHKTKTMRTHIWANVTGFLKMAGVQAIFYGISYLLSDIVIKTISWRKEQNRVKNLVKDTMDELNTEIKTPGQQETELWNLKMAAFDTHSYDADRKKIVDSINRILGTQFDVETSNYEINKAVNERLKLLKEERIYQTNNAKLAELREQKEKKLAEIQRKREEVAEKEAKKKTLANMGSGYSTIRAGYTKEINTLKKEIGLFETEVANLTTAIEQITKDNEPYLRNLGPRQKALEGPEITNEDFSDEVVEGETLTEQYNKIKKEYTDNLRSLDEQKKHQLLTEKEYTKALGELEVKTAEAILALDDINEATDKFAAARVLAAQQYLLTKEKEDKAQKALTDYYKETLALADQLDMGIISQEEYESALQSLKEEVLKQLLAMGELTDSAQELADMYKQKKDYDSNKKDYNSNKEAYDLVNSGLPTLGSRDTTFDYKKEDSEKFSEMAEIYEEYVDGLNDLIEKIEKIQEENPTGRNADMLEELNLLLEQASQNAETFEDASKFAQVQEDVKNLKAELAEGIFDNISNIATAAERLTNSWKTLTETMDDPDASGWEKFITIFTTIMSVIETVVGVVKAFQAVMAVAETLSLASAAAEQAGIPVKVQDAIATQAQAAAAKQLAIARHMSAAAAVPYPANIAAIASTAGALAAAFAALPAFAEGGIVRGASSVGDRNLVRVNAGEAILTKMQQANLWHLLNGQGALLGKGVGGNVEFKIRGADLVGTINNYSKKISK